MGGAAAWCDAARRGEERWRAQPRDVGGGPGAGAVSFDDLAFVASGKLATPAQHTVNGPLLLAVTDEAYVDALRGETTAGMAEVAGYCPWFEGLWEKARRDNVGVVAVRQLLPQVQDDAATERRRESAAAQTRERAFDDATRALCDRVSEVLVVAPGGDEDLDLETVGRLQDALSGFQAACQEVQRLGPVAAGFDTLRSQVEKLSLHALAAQKALAEAEQIGAVHAVFLKPQRVIAGAAVVGLVLLLRVPAALYVLVGLFVLVVGYRVYAGFQATESALEKLRLFGLHARSFVRDRAARGNG